MLLNDKAIFLFYSLKSVCSYCITVLLPFPEAAIKSWKLKFIEKCLKKSSIFINVVDLKLDTSNFLQKNICTYYLPFLKKLCIEFEVFWKSPQPTSSFLGANLDPIGQVYVRGISMEHLHEILPVYLEKNSLWNSRDIPILWNTPCFKPTSSILCYR